jgi:hypothetical protein
VGLKLLKSLNLTNVYPNKNKNNNKNNKVKSKPLELCSRVKSETIITMFLYREPLIEMVITFLKEPFLALDGADCDHGTNMKQNRTSWRNLITAFVLILAIYYSNVSRGGNCEAISDGKE